LDVVSAILAYWCPELILKKKFDFLYSRRLAICLTLLLGAVVFVGTLVPQNRPAEYYKAHYNEWACKLLISLDINNIFKSWYFVAALIFFAICLLACTVRRLWAAISAFRPQRSPVPFEEQTSCLAEIGPEADFKTVIGRLRLLPFNWRENDGVFYGRRRPAAMVGTVFIHIGLLLALLGAALGVLSHRGEISIFKGQKLALPSAYGKGYEIRADGVDETADANTGKVLSRRTSLSVMRYEDDVGAGEVDVNKPLRHRGLAIYLSGMAAAGAKGLFLEEVRLKSGAAADGYGRVVFSWTVGDESGDEILIPGEGSALGRSGFNLRYVEYFERFYASEEGIGDDGADYNPAAFVEIENDKGETANGVLFKLYPERSFLRADVPDFTDSTLRIDYGADDGPWRAERREYLLASGSYVAFGGGDTMKIVMAEGESRDLRDRRLEGIIERSQGGEERLEFPFGARVSVRTNGGVSIFRFLGSRTAPVAVLTVAREPGLVFFYLACLFFSVGVVVAAALRYDELVAYVRDGRVYLAGRSSKGPRVLKPAFDGWVTAVKGN
jgi:cytochrome c biogenesis protein ResB